MAAILEVPQEASNFRSANDTLFEGNFPPLGFKDYKTMRIRVNPVERLVRDFGGREIYGEDHQNFRAFETGGFETVNRWMAVYNFPDKYGRDLTGARVVINGDLFGGQRNGYSSPVITARIEEGKHDLSILKASLEIL